MPEIFTHRYGIKSYHKQDDLWVELKAYQKDLTPEQGGLGSAAHFRNIAQMLWGPNSEEQFVWNPWAERMNAVCHQHPITGAIRPHVGLSGCASSGKSQYGGLFALINWLCDPLNTYVFVTSTSLSEAKHRIWKSVVKLYMGAPQLAGIGKLVDSQGKICTLKEDGKHDDTAGIFLIAAAVSKEREAVAKLIGKKNKRVILIADELPELSHSVLDAFFSNLIANPINQFVAMGNFKSRYDPFGEFVQPKAGYDSIGIETDEWETERGYCVRFDGMKSPNIISGKDEYKYLYGSKQLAEHKKNFGEGSALFWRMCRSFESPVGLDNIIYSEADLVSGKASDHPVWIMPPVRLSAMDPSYTNGGDRTVQLIGEYGQTVDGLWTIHVSKYITIYEDASSNVPRDYQVVRKFRDNCMTEGVSPENAGLDETGAGSVLLSIAHEEWDNKVVGINFSGRASDMPVTMSDPVPAKDKYDRRVSELWYVGKEFLKYGQIKGITNDLARELKARQYDTVKGPEGLKISVEPKKEMKVRIGFSPDCFIAGTIVETSRGPVAIESLNIGDVVHTPFGPSPIIALHSDEVDVLTTARFSNGSFLSGKGKHRVFTWDKGWVRLDNLSIANELESAQNQCAWNILNTLLEKAGNTGFKAMVDTIKTGTKLRRRDFYTGPYGLRNMGRFLSACVSTIRMVTGQIIDIPIWNLWEYPSMLRCTYESGLKILNFEPETKSISLKQLSQQKRGTAHRMGLSGTASMDEILGRTEKMSFWRALNAALSSRLNGPMRGFAQTHAGPKDSTGNLGIKGFVLSVVKCLMRFATQSRPIVPVVVQQSQLPEKRKVYNITLAEHNAYYANGVLVENCADAWTILVDLCRRNFGALAGGENTGMRRNNADWEQQVKNADAMYANVNYEPEYA